MFKKSIFWGIKKKEQKSVYGFCGTEERERGGGVKVARGQCFFGGGGGGGAILDFLFQKVI